MTDPVAAGFGVALAVCFLFVGYCHGRAVECKHTIRVLREVIAMLEEGDAD